MSFARPIDEHRFREATARQAKMPGVTGPSFVCVACKRRSVTKGCKQLSIGRICAACNEAREYRKAIREAKQCSR
jgi:CRISPR/Cas system-associated protein Cas10 (large subunit of type III CRISPR-Cas system)